MKKIVTCGALTMMIDRKQDAIKSQRMVNTMLNAKRDNCDINPSELYHLAIGWKAGSSG